MEDYVILTDSTCDLPADLAEEMGIVVIPLSVMIDSISYKNYLDGREISFQDFYDSMRNKKLPNTAAVNVFDFTELLDPILASGKNVLYIGFSSAMSGTYSAGCIAAAELLEKYPERTVRTVDSLCASLGEGLLVYLCALEKQKGKSIEEVQQFAEDNKMHMCHLFTVNDLFYIMRGGRVSASVAIFGSILGIKPILRVDEAGLMDTIGKARGRKSALRTLIQEVKENVTQKDTPVFIGHGDCIEDAEYVKEQLENEIGLTNVYIGYIGVVCGSHSGPGILGIFYHGKKRK